MTLAVQRLAGGEASVREGPTSQQATEARRGAWAPSEGVCCCYSLQKKKTKHASNDNYRGEINNNNGKCSATKMDYFIIVLRNLAGKMINWTQTSTGSHAANALKAISDSGVCFFQRSNWPTAWLWAGTLRCLLCWPTTAWRPGPAPSSSSPGPSATTGSWETAVDSFQKKWRCLLEKVSRQTLTPVATSCLTRARFLFPPRKTPVPHTGVRTVRIKNNLRQVDQAVGHHHRQADHGFP